MELLLSVASTFKCQVPTGTAGIVISAVESDKRLSTSLRVLYPVLEREAVTRVTPAGTDCGSIFNVILPEELEGEFIDVLFYEHPIKRSKNEKESNNIFRIIYAP